VVGMSEGGGLSELDMLILRRLLRTGGIEELAMEAKVPATTLGKEIARLQLGGYIANDGSLTEKGAEAAKTQ